MRSESGNPAPLIESVFGRIAETRMAGLPLNNPALHVEACGFRCWDGLWLGALVTPWAINLMLLPGTNPAFRRLGPDERQRWVFPSGAYEFMGREEEGLGAYQCLSLFSPAFECPCQEDARQAAQAALDALLSAADGGPSMSRRAFLGGFLARRDDEARSTAHLI